MKLRQLLLGLLSVPSAFAANLITSHVDIRFDYRPTSNDWTCVLQYGLDFDNPNFEVAPEAAALPLRDAPTNGGDRVVQPASAAFAFTGATPGSPLWNLPQSNRGYTWPGFDNHQTPGTFLSYLPVDSRVTVAARWLKVSLVGVEYSGASTSHPRFSLWNTGNFGVPKIWMTTTDGISEADSFYYTENSHVHMNWGFTALGIYRITLRASAVRASNGQLVQSGDYAITFAVGTLATWRATHFSGSDIVNALIGTPLADPDGDGSQNLVEYAFNSNPTTPSSLPIVAGTGIGGLPLVRLENIEGRDRLTIEFVRRKSSTNPQIIYTPEFSSTLAVGDWLPGGLITVTSIDASWERVKIVDADLPGTKRFGRVRVTLLPTISY